MFTKVIAFFTLVVSVRCVEVAYQSAYPLAAQTYVADSPHVGLQSEQTVRGFAGSSISHQQKAINSHFSSASKTDTRITNPSVYAAVPAQAVYSSPAVYQQAYAPAIKTIAAAPAVYQQTYANQVVAAPAPVYQHSAPVYQHAAPVYQHAAPVYHHQAAPVYAAAPVKTVAAPVAYAQGPIAKVAAPLLGVQYSAVSPAVATLNFNGYGISYGY